MKLSELNAKVANLLMHYGDLDINVIFGERINEGTDTFARHLKLVGVHPNDEKTKAEIYLEERA